MEADSFGWGALWAALGALFGTVATGFFAWLTQRTKGDSARDVAVLAQWEKLTGALSKRIGDVEAELAKVRSDHSTEIAAIRKAHSEEIEAMRKAHFAEIDEVRKTHRAEMKAMRELNEGLQRMIAQDSQSTARLLGTSPVTSAFQAPDDEGSGK